MKDLRSLLSSTTLLADGAMGTMLHARGVGFEKCFDELNLTNPAVVGEVHREYIEAGAQIVLTNTFGSNRFKLEQHGLVGKAAEINHAGVELARRVASASFKEVLIAGDVGPLGVRIAPFGRVKREQARQAFAEQISALSGAGVDLIVIETVSDLYEMIEAVNAAHEINAAQKIDLPIIASITFTRDDRTLLGDGPEKVARTLFEVGADLIGVNCSGGPAQLLRILRQMRQAVPDGKFWVKPNAGWPEQVGGRIMYPADPDYFGDYAVAMREGGASVVGGCCGTTPAHIAAMRRALDSAPLPSISILQSSDLADNSDVSEERTPPTQLAQKLARGKFVLSVEMDPPRGLSTHKLLAGASMLSEAGADVINVADSPMARMRMSAWAVCDVVQRQAGIETTLHFPTRGRNLIRVQGDLLAAHAIGLRNVFVVMGDPTSIGDYPEATDNYDLVPSGLIKLIKEGFNTGLDHAGTSIGQPTSFYVGAALNLSASEPEREMTGLRRKLKSGADFFLTQPIYDSDRARAFLDMYAEKYGQLDKPILVGILPLVSVKHANFLQHEVPGVTIPPATLERIEKAGEDAANEGVAIAIELVQEIKNWAQGVYLMPQFNRFDLVAEIVDAVKENVGV